jgi:hypothetical protein
MKVFLDNVQYHPERGTVAVLISPPMGGGFFVNLLESEAEAKLPGGAGNWGNDEIMAVVRDVLGSQEEFTKRTSMAAELYPEEGFTVLFRAAPAAPPAPPAPVTEPPTPPGEPAAPAPPASPS